MVHVWKKRRQICAGSQKALRGFRTQGLVDLRSPSGGSPSTHTISNIGFVYLVMVVRERETESYHLATCQRHHLAPEFSQKLQ